MKTRATLEELATLVGGKVEGDGSLPIRGIASLEDAGEGEITFLAEIKHSRRLEKSRASAAIVPTNLPSFPRPLIRTPNPHLAYAKVQAFFQEKPFSPRGVDSRAFIGEGVKIGRDVSIYPFVYVGAGSEIGDRVILHPGVCLGESVQVGEGSVLYPNVVVMDRCVVGKRVILHPGTVIGSDGFGFARDGKKFVKIPQVGIVVIEDDVEIGANCAVDRAAMGKTWIKRGVKTDNLIQIGHNVTVGEDTVIVAQVGIAGSTEIGNRVALGGQAGVVGHIKIGDGAMIGAQAGVGQDVAPGQILSGSPAFPHREWLRAQAAFPKLPEMKRALAELEKRITQIEEALSGQRSAVSKGPDRA
ncbi:MAG: UDP-3-O-(3-hydroxymyristoyl) glucosamine N-acyltransferase [Deltaproteobacteria bacterium SM23_61]|nr:MAG: UDP-3-O-(3-hydroxymyristoyl) glucosamine N-acyltransferase [Deltaproteobacteria bacterium SM23_61]